MLDIADFIHSIGPEILVAVWNLDTVAMDQRWGTYIVKRLERYGIKMTWEQLSSKEVDYRTDRSLKIRLGDKEMKDIIERKIKRKQNEVSKKQKVQ